MEFAGNLLSAVIKDSFVFAGQLIILLIWYYKTSIKGTSRFIILMYGAITFSAYNLYLRVIQDFNLPISRTFINKYSLAGPIYLIDIFILFIAVCLILKLFVHRLKVNVSYHMRPAILVYIFHLLIYLISCVGLLLYVQLDNFVEIREQLRPLRGLALGGVAIWCLGRLLDEAHSVKDIHKILLAFVFIDSVNILGELVSSQIFTDYVWQRGGHKVLLLDQANAALAISCLPFIAFWRRFDLKIVFFSLAIGLLIFYDFVKVFILTVPALVILFGVVSTAAKRTTLTYLVVALLIVGAGYGYFLGVFQDKAISGTRLIQLNSYLSYTSDDYSAIFLGSGFGGKYKMGIDTEDDGEMKEIDREASTGYQHVFQVPFFAYYKVGGGLGMIVLLLFAFFLFLEAVVQRARAPIVSMFILLVMLSILKNAPLLTSNPDGVIYFVRLLFALAIFHKFGAQICIKNNSGKKPPMPVAISN